jgi:hypothetical protein
MTETLNTGDLIDMMGARFEMVARMGRREGDAVLFRTRMAPGIGACCLGSLTAEASCVRIASTANVPAADMARRTLPNAIAVFFFVAISHLKLDCVRPLMEVEDARLSGSG